MILALEYYISLATKARVTDPLKIPMEVSRTSNYHTS